MNFLAKHRKLIVFVIGVLVNFAVWYFANNAQALTYVNLAITVLTGAGLYQASNAPIDTPQ